MSNAEGGNLPRGLFYVALIFGAFFVGQSSFEALRPTQQQAIDYHDSTNFSIQARLWQDPHSAVTEYFNATERQGNPLIEQTALKQPMLNLLSEVLWSQEDFRACWKTALQAPNEGNTSRCDFEKLSTTWNWLPLGWAINMRQLFVPRSSAA